MDNDTTPQHQWGPSGLKVMTLTVIIQVLVIYLSVKVIGRALHLESRLDIGHKHVFQAGVGVSRVIYSVIVVSLAVIEIVRHHKIMMTHFIDWESTIIDFLLALTIGYHVVDTAVVLVNDFVYNIRQKVLFVHHLLMFMLYVSVYLTGHGYVYATLFILVEIEIPLINIYGLCPGLKLRMRDSMFYHVNNAVMIHLFHLRHGFEFFLGLLMYWNWDAMATKMAPVTCVAMCVHLVTMFTCVTPFWTYVFSVSSVQRFLAKKGEHAKVVERNGRKSE